MEVKKERRKEKRKVELGSHSEFTKSLRIHARLFDGRVEGGGGDTELKYRRNVFQPGYR